MIISNEIDALETMYPSFAEKIEAGKYKARPYSTLFGFVLSGEVKFPNGNVAVEGQYFSAWTGSGLALKVTGEVAGFTRLGFKGQNTIGGPIEETGRLCYIDSCSDSLLVYPPRMGDASLNQLYFPPNVKQSFHIHPSVRLGVVVRGKGKACLKGGDGNERQIDLVPGVVFCIEERENHRFMTEESDMTVIAYHPDGDWGPTDHNHTMLNRTYISK